MAFLGRSASQVKSINGRSTTINGSCSAIASGEDNLQTSARPLPLLPKSSSLPRRALRLPRSSLSVERVTKPVPCPPKSEVKFSNEVRNDISPALKKRAEVRKNTKSELKPTPDAANLFYSTAKRADRRKPLPKAELKLVDDVRSDSTSAQKRVDVLPKPKSDVTPSDDATNLSSSTSKRVARRKPLLKVELKCNDDATNGFTAATNRADRRHKPKLGLTPSDDLINHSNLTPKQAGRENPLPNAEVKPKDDVRNESTPTTNRALRRRNRLSRNLPPPLAASSIAHKPSSSEAISEGTTASNKSATISFADDTKNHVQKSSPLLKRSRRRRASTMARRQFVQS